MPIISKKKCKIIYLKNIHSEKIKFENNEYDQEYRFLNEV